MTILLKDIGNIFQNDPSTISKEVKLHRIKKNVLFIQHIVMQIPFVRILIHVRKPLIMVQINFVKPILIVRNHVQILKK